MSFWLGAKLLDLLCTLTRTQCWCYTASRVFLPLLVVVVLSLPTPMQGQRFVEVVAEPKHVDAFVRVMDQAPIHGVGQTTFDKAALA
jgi:hypothetical protein